MMNKAIEANVFRKVYPPSTTAADHISFRHLPLLL